MDFHLLHHDILTLWPGHQFSLDPWELCKMQADISLFFGYNHIRLSPRRIHTLLASSQSKQTP